MTERGRKKKIGKEKKGVGSKGKEKVRGKKLGIMETNRTPYFHSMKYNKIDV